MGFPQIGQVLKNGHTVDAAYCVGDTRYVLAHRDGECEQFVVWNVDQDGDTVNGRYFADPAAAQKKFAECCFDIEPRSGWETEVSDMIDAHLEELKSGLLREAEEEPAKSHKNAGAPESKDELRRKIDERKSTVDAVIQLIIERMEEKDMGHLTTGFVIGVLRDAIEHLESASFMRPASDCFTKAVSPEDFLHYTTSVKDMAKAMERMGKYSRCGF